MGTTQPIRNEEDVKKLMDYYKTVEPHPRNYALIVLGLHTALRISDLLHIKWEHVYDFKKERFYFHLHINERKTGKTSIIALNRQVEEALDNLWSICDPKATDYLFSKTTTPDRPLSRTQAHRIIKKAAKSATTQDNISCHSMRKTFGYYAWKQGASPVLLMEVYNHSSFSVTKRYLGINQDERDSVFLNLHY